MGYLKWLWPRIPISAKLFILGVLYIFSLAYGLTYSPAIAYVLSVGLLLFVVGFLGYVIVKAFKESYEQYKYEEDR